MEKLKFVTSEFVSFGHPDKIADQIADALLDEILTKDPNARTGIEVMVKDNIVVLGGEVNSRITIEYDRIVRTIFNTLDFPSNHHLSPNEIKIINLIGKQSEEIHSGVDRKEEICAGDQGFMVGYACNETSTYMPLGHYIAKKICTYVARCQPLLGPDVKTQVIIGYDNENKPVSIHSILVSTMHQCSLEQARDTVEIAIKRNFVKIDEEIFKNFFDGKKIDITVNPCGAWQIGGPISDCGVTGRKLVVDSYGGYCNIGGGAYCGKDMTKVDRSGAYMARYLAKNIVASGFCDSAKVTLSYMIGVAQPCCLEIEVNRNAENIWKLKEWISKNIDLTPGSYCKKFALNNGYQFYMTSKFGHFGVDYDDPNYPWEKLDIADDLKKLLSTD